MRNTAPKTIQFSRGRKNLELSDKGVPQNHGSDKGEIVSIEQTKDSSVGTHDPQIAMDALKWGFESLTRGEVVLGVEGEVGPRVVGGLVVDDVAAVGGGGGGEEVELEEVGVED